jgi:ethanolamine utilization protein EutA
VKERILSVGIDIGTSTTVVVFSNIYIENVAKDFRIPDAKIVEKQVIYRSPVYITPLVSNTELDVDGITKIVMQEYRNGGIDPSDVQTGAVIITGDTARKTNAEKVLHSISRYAGDFVVATAGPELESILAGKGSGAQQYSLDSVETITNLDVGGGTTNIATFHNGNVMDVDCLDIGGRLIRFRPGTLEVEYIFHKIQQLAKQLGISITAGNMLNRSQIRAVSKALAKIILESFSPGSKSEQFYQLRTKENSRPPQAFTKVVSFSGGVGDLVYMENLPPEDAYDDIGVCLAKEILEQLRNTGLKVVKPTETIGATVVGAGSHSMEISGSTVMISQKEVLPIKNIPILKLPNIESLSPEDFSAAIQQNIRWIQGYDESQNVALAVDCASDANFRTIEVLADKIMSGMESMLKKQSLLVVVMKNDFGKVLGQSLRLRLPADKEVLCLDGINMQNGDYIDIGKPVGVGDALPVVVKTLAFSY